MRHFRVIAVCAALCAMAIGSSAAIASAGQKSACHVLPGATVSAALRTHFRTAESQTQSPNGGNSFTCTYVGPQIQGVSFTVYYESSPAKAAADRAGWSRLAAAMSRSGGTGMSVTKGDIALSIFVYQPTSKSTLSALVAAAERNL
jgi:hypothetical protein